MRFIQFMTSVLAGVVMLSLARTVDFADQGDRIMTSAEVEELLGLAPGTCAQNRLAAARGAQPVIPYFRIGRRIRYRLSEVERFLDAQTVRDTSGPQDAA